jgi:hypothetical protein
MCRRSDAYRPEPGTALVVKAEPPADALARLRVLTPADRAQFRAALADGADFPPPSDRARRDDRG